MIQKGDSELAHKLRGMANELLSVADALEVPISVADKVKRITNTLGTGETARRLRVDPSTVISWRNGHGLLHSNLLKLLQLYNELFGNEG